MTHSWYSKINHYPVYLYIYIYVLLTVKKGIYILQFPAQGELSNLPLSQKQSFTCQHFLSEISQRDISISESSSYLACIFKIQG